MWRLKFIFLGATSTNSMQCWIELKICNIQLFSFSIRLLKNLYLYIRNMINQIFYFVDLNGLNDPLHGKTAVERRATMQNAASYMPANLNQQLCNFFWEVTKWNKWTLTSDVYWLKFRPLKKKTWQLYCTLNTDQPGAECCLQTSWHTSNHLFRKSQGLKSNNYVQL